MIISKFQRMNDTNCRGHDIDDWDERPESHGCTNEVSCARKCFDRGDCGAYTWSPRGSALPCDDCCYLKVNPPNVSGAQGSGF